MERIAGLERKSIHGTTGLNDGWTAADRKWILDTYAECLNAAKGFC